MKKMIFIVNPLSGKMKIQSVLLEVIKMFNEAGYSTQVCATLRRGHAAQIAAEAPEDTDIIVCSGGDGTLNEVVSGVLKAGKVDIPIGYLPAGSTNDFANTFGLQTDIKKAAAAVICGTPQAVDIGLFDENDYFSYIASFGVFTSISYNTPQSIKNTFGHLAYVFGGIKDITKIIPYRVTVEADGRTYEGDYIFGSVTNTTSVGGIVKLDSSLVKMNDGLFETVLVKNPANINDLNKIIGGLTTSNFNDNVFEFIKSEKIVMHFKEEMDWSLDGEHKKSGKDVIVKNLTKAIKLIK